MALAYGPGEIDSLDWRSRHEALLKQIAASVAIGGGAAPPPPPTITFAARISLIAQYIKVGQQSQVFSANAARLKVRVTNNTGPTPAGSGIPDPYGTGIPDPYGVLPTEPCYVIIGCDRFSPLTAESWDQIAGPGRSIELDAPALEFYVAVSSRTPASIAGRVLVTQYFAL